MEAKVCNNSYSAVSLCLSSIFLIQQPGLIVSVAIQYVMFVSCSSQVIDVVYCTQDWTDKLKIQNLELQRALNEKSKVML